MKRTILATFVFVTWFILFQNAICSAGINLPWSTTYNVSDWNSGMGGTPPSGDNLECGLTGSEGSCQNETITAAANYAGGGGGKGQRHPVCNGLGNSGGGTMVYFNQPQSELWVRWYIRYQSGFEWSSFIAGKIFYLYTNGSVQCIPEWYGADNFNFALQGAGQNTLFSGRGFTTMNGGSKGDGKWHYLEIHMKGDTNGSNGIAEVWMDSLPVSSRTNLNYGMAGGAKWVRMTIMSNYNAIANGPWNVDIDDIAISSTGRIGPIGSTPTPTPAPTATPTPTPAPAPTATPTPTPVGTSSTAIFSEDFEDANFAARSWYDNTNLTLTTAEHVSGSTKSVEFSWLQGGSNPASGGAIRKIIPDTDEVYLRYYVKYSANWEGSNTNTHPHEFYLLTNLNGTWDGLAYTYLTAYIEQNEGEPLFAIQDSQSIDVARVNQNLTTVTENRAVAGCNGDSDGYGAGSCYSNGSVYLNGKFWRAGSTYFRDTAGPYYKNDWHLVEAYIKLNTITNGKANKDGQMKYWFDGSSVMNLTNVVIRTGQHANMKFNQLVIGPYMGSSPVAQKMWIDNLYVGTSRPTSNGALAAPSNLRKVSP